MPVKKNNHTCLKDRTLLQCFYTEHYLTNLYCGGINKSIEYSKNTFPII